MRSRFIGVLFAIACALSGSWALAQEDQTQVGYAVISPGSGTSTMPESVDVFQTFAFTHTGGEQQAGLPATQMTTTGLMFVDVSDSAGDDTAIAFTNPNSAPAQIQLTLYRQDGTIVERRTDVIQARLQTPLYVTELFPGVAELQEEFTGTLAFQSSVPVAAISLRFRNASFSTEPISQLSEPQPIPPIGTASNPLFMLPNIVAGGGWTTEIVVLNPSSSNATVRLDFFSSGGSPQNFTVNGDTRSTFPSFTIRARGVLVLQVE